MCQNTVEILADICLTAVYLHFLTENLLDALQDCISVQSHLLNKLSDQSLLLREQRVKQMDLFDFLVSVFVRYTLTALNGLQGILCKFLDIHTLTSFLFILNSGY